jgi:glycosyltransferase involved in cell wall biosynthesis
MRLVFLQKTTDARGGSKASLRNTLKALSTLQDLDIEVCGEARGPLSEFAESLGLRFRVMPFPRWRQVTDRLFFRSKMKRFAGVVGKADWVISNEMWWAPHAVELAKYCGARSAAIVRDEIADLKKARQYSFSNLNRVITVSEDLKRQLICDSEICAKTRTIYNIVERPVSNPEDASVIKQVCGACPSVRRWILSAGTICPRKNQILLVQALAELKERGDVDSGVLFVGGEDDSGYAAELKQEVASYGLDRRVAFSGQLSGIGSALEIAGLFVLTSHSEGLPRVLIESILAGVPAISTKVSGVDEVFGSESECFVLGNREPAALAEKMESLFDQAKDLTIDEIGARLNAHFSGSAHLESWKSFLQ